jgi:anthranilate phosphoribosyltransferase
VKKILQYLFEYKSLTADKAKEVLVDIGKGAFNEHEVTAFMTVFLMRSITIDELQGFREALLQLAVPVELDKWETLDIVGTGGDGKNTFNISTLSCFIAAGAGHPVAKHGNYGASSISGASNVMETLGYRFKTSSKELEKELEMAGICFLHAPLFHPALKTVAPIRRNLAMRTFFNMLGPLANPARPSFQLIGVFSAEMARVYSYFLQLSGKPFTIIHAVDGYDEISLTNDTKVITEKGEKVLTPENLGKRMVAPSDITGGTTVDEAAAIFVKILRREGTWAQNAVVIANAALAIHSTGRYNNYEHAYLAAVASLEEGKAYNCFEQLMKLQ